MKIYVWNPLDLGTYYADGLIVIVAKDLKAARKLALQQLGSADERIQRQIKEKPDIYDPNKMKSAEVIAEHSGSD